MLSHLIPRAGYLHERIIQKKGTLYYLSLRVDMCASRCPCVRGGGCSCMLDQVRHSRWDGDRNHDCEKMSKGVGVGGIETRNRREGRKGA